jgi:hypothetical protein
MRSFVCSALFIAVVLIGQQLVTRSSEANGLAGHPVPTSTAINAWLANVA